MHGRILITDSTTTNRIIFKVKLTDAFYGVALASDGQTCLKLARETPPDVIVTNLELPDMTGSELLNALRADPRTRNVPVIAISGSNALEPRLAAYRAGAADVLQRPFNDGVLLARIRRLIRRRQAEGLVAQAWGEGDASRLNYYFGLSEPQATFHGASEIKANIAIITTHPETGTKWRHALRGYNSGEFWVFTREQALTFSRHMTEAPDLFLIEADLHTSGDGLRLMSQLSLHPHSRHSAFCIVTTPMDDAIETMALDLGADDVVPHNLPQEELALRLRTVLRSKNQANHLRATVEDGLRHAMIDPLTGCYNRRYALPRLAGIAQQALYEGSQFAVFIVDIDHFKSVNDRFGHSIGDQVLIEVARRLNDNMCLNGMIARYGGEEFLIVLPQTSPAEADRMAEKLRMAIGAEPFDLGNNIRLTVTISVGVSFGPIHHSHNSDLAQVNADLAQVVDCADRALLGSKTAGRNLVTFSQSAA